MPTTDTTQLPFAKSHAFLVAINDYQHVSSLETPVADVTRLAEKLKQDHDYVVHDPLLNPTRDELQQWLTEELPKLVQKTPEGERKERILFYFAGHGIAFESDYGPQGYLVPADAQRKGREYLLAMNEVYEALSALPCDHGLLILDCCFAGSFRWAQKSRSLVLDELPHIIYEERFLRYCLDPAWQVLCSSGHDQKALDILEDFSLGFREEEQEAKHSPFALAMFDALDGEADCVPAGGDGLITATELYLFLRDQVEGQTISRNGLRQTPLLFPLPRHDKGEYIFLTPGAEDLKLDPTPKQNPFKGLTAFEEADASLFYGRDGILKNLRAHFNAHSLTVVVGASGTGKSSLIKAGLLPLLRDKYSVLEIFRPGKTPLKSLEQAYPDLLEISQRVTTVLVIDQFEELLTQTIKEEEAALFQRRLSNLIQRNSFLKVIISIRSDFEPQFERGPLRALWQAGRFPVTPFTPAELRQVIVQPALQEVFEYDPPALINTIIDEVSQAPGGLPLLSFTLSELYHAYIDSGRTDRLFTQASYQQLGGVIGSLRTKADALYQSLPPEEQNTMRRLMLRMVSLEGGETAGKRAYLEELQFPEATENQRVQTVLDQLVNARLLIRDKDPQGRSFVEPAHDALVRAWATLWEWIKTTGEERIILQNKLGQAVDDYEEGATERNLLWSRDPRLGLLEGELSIQDSWMNTRERGFVQTSVKRRKFLRRRNYSILVGVIIGLASLAGVAIVQANVATVESQRAIRRAEYAEAQTLVFQLNEFTPNYDERAMRMLAEKWKHLNDVGVELPPYLTRKIVQPIYDQFATLKQVPRLLNDQTFHLTLSAIPATFSPDGSLILTSSWDNTAKLWDLQGKLIADFDKHTNRVTSAIFSPDGSQILTRSNDDTDKLWDLQGKLIADLNKHKGQIWSAIFSPDGSHILTSSDDGTAKLWDLRGNLIADLDKRVQSVVSAIFSPDGRLILTSSWDNTAKLWDLQGNVIADLDKHTGEVSSAIFSPDGRYILTRSNDGTAKLWPTPRTVYEWLQSPDCPIPPLTKAERIQYNLPSGE